MSRVALGEVELEFEDEGDPQGPPVVLAMGLGRQLVDWPPELVGALVDAGCRVVRFDARDAGASTKLAGPAPAPARLVPRALLGLPVEVPWRLEDAARDVVGLLDHLGLARAHLVGTSFGGMLAQVLALRWPARVASLALLMTTAGRLRDFRPGGLRRLAGRPPADREGLVRRQVDTLAAFASPRHPADREALRARAERALARGFCPLGVRRQVAAVVADGSRERALAAVTAPTLVVHGALDPLIRPGAARALARAIPGARLELLADMGHDLTPPPIAEHVGALLAAHALGAEAPRPAGAGARA